MFLQVQPNSKWFIGKGTKSCFESGKHMWRNTRKTCPNPWCSPYFGWIFWGWRAECHQCFAVCSQERLTSVLLNMCNEFLTPTMKSISCHCRLRDWLFWKWISLKFCVSVVNTVLRCLQWPSLLLVHFIFSGGICILSFWLLFQVWN